MSISLCLFAVQTAKADDTLSMKAGSISIARVLHHALQFGLVYSQLAPLDMYKEVNTGNNLPAQIELYATKGDEYHFLFMAKGGLGQQELPLSKNQNLKSRHNLQWEVSKIKEQGIPIRKKQNTLALLTTSNIKKSLEAVKQNKTIYSLNYIAY